MSRGNDFGRGNGKICSRARRFSGTKNGFSGTKISGSSGRRKPFWRERQKCRFSAAANGRVERVCVCESIVNKRTPIFSEIALHARDGVFSAVSGTRMRGKFWQAITAENLFTIFCEQCCMQLPLDCEGCCEQTARRFPAWEAPSGAVGGKCSKNDDDQPATPLFITISRERPRGVPCCGFRFFIGKIRAEPPDSGNAASLPRV